jgi:group I intron endonuclease
MIGIYKITSPSNRVYIGQSIHIQKRFTEYKSLRNCKEQAILYRSLIKYGSDKHLFEVIEECEEVLLNERERYWQDYYDVLGLKGLNCKLTRTENRSGKLSEATKQKISETSKKTYTDERKAASSLRQKQRSQEVIAKIARANTGKKRTQETKNKMSISGKLSKTEEVRNKISAANKGKILTSETLQKMINSKKNISQETRNKMSEAKKGKVRGPYRKL